MSNRSRGRGPLSDEETWTMSYRIATQRARAIARKMKLTDDEAEELRDHFCDRVERVVVPTWTVASEVDLRKGLFAYFNPGRPGPGRHVYDILGRRGRTVSLARRNGEGIWEEREIEDLAMGPHETLEARETLSGCLVARQEVWAYLEAASPREVQIVGGLVSGLNLRQIADAEAGGLATKAQYAAIRKAWQRMWPRLSEDIRAALEALGIGLKEDPRKGQREGPTT